LARQARVPFREVSVVTQKDVDEVKRLSGKNDLPWLVVGNQLQTGFQESLLNGLLDSAGYPISVPPARIEALRKDGSPTSAPAKSRHSHRMVRAAGAEPATDAGAR